MPWALVNLDRTTEEDGLPGVVELKSRSSYALNDWLDEVPIDVQVQVQWQLMVTGWSFGYTAALIGGQRTIVHRIERDEQIIDDLLAIAAEFWGWVETGTQPPIDGSVATGQLLDRLHANPTETDVVADPPKSSGGCSIRRTAKEQPPPPTSPLPTPTTTSRPWLATAPTSTSAANSPTRGGPEKARSAGRKPPSTPTPTSTPSRTGASPPESSTSSPGEP
jgi:hypothetical protein